MQFWHLLEENRIAALAQLKQYDFGGKSFEDKQMYLRLKLIARTKFIY